MDSAATSSSSAGNPPHNSIPQRRRYIPEWMKLNFDRLNHATNFEEYGSSPPDTAAEFIRTLDVKLGQAAEHSNAVPSVLLNQPAEKRQKKLHRRHHEMKRPLSSPQFENVLDSCMAYSSCSSTEVTPAVTPQGSPCLTRRILTQENLFPPSDSSATNTSKPLLPITEMSEASTTAAPVNQMKAKKITKACKQRVVDASLGPKKYLVTNFDINAVGPTSW